MAARKGGRRRKPTGKQKSAAELGVFGRRAKPAGSGRKKRAVKVKRKGTAYVPKKGKGFTKFKFPGPGGSTGKR